jgi:hypothetical protein
VQLDADTKNIRQHGLYLLVPPFALAFCALLLYPGSSKNSLERLIVDGYVWGLLGDLRVLSIVPPDHDRVVAQRSFAISRTA